MTKYNSLIFVSILLAFIFLLSGCVPNNTLYLPDGSKYVGEIINDKPNGKGTLVTPSEDVYSGQFKNGDIVIGEMTNFALNGLCKVKLANGTSFNREFKDGKPVIK